MIAQANEFGVESVGYYLSMKFISHEVKYIEMEKDLLVYLMGLKEVETLFLVL